MIEAISSIQATQDISSIEKSMELKQATNLDFSQLISTGVAQLNENINASDKAMTDYIFNKGISTHELMITMEKAKHSMQVAVEVRNKVVEAYRQITQMQV